MVFRTFPITLSVSGGSPVWARWMASAICSFVAPLQQESGGPEGYSPRYVSRIFMPSKHNDLRSGRTLDDPFQSLQTIGIRHPDIEQYDIGLSRHGLFDRLIAPSGFGQDLDFGTLQ
jgi:hypothetical protein